MTENTAIIIYRVRGPEFPILTSVVEKESRMYRKIVYTVLVCFILVAVNLICQVIFPPNLIIPQPLNASTGYTKGIAQHDKQKNTQQKPTKRVVLLFWSNLWGKRATRVERIWEMGNKTGQCPVACEITSDRSRIKQANACIVHARDPRPLPPTKAIPWVLTTLENPVYTPVLRDPKYMAQFHLLRSYRLDADFPTPSFKAAPNLSPPIPFRNKTGNIMAAFSNCEKVRTEYLKQLMKFVKVDSYGGCLKNKPKDLVQRYGKNFEDAKTQLARRYKFLIVFFNQDCDYFVDDQILHAFNAGTVPIVMSTNKIMEFLPGNLNHSIINVRDFKNPKHLADYLIYLSNNETEYNTYFQWKAKGLGAINDTVIGRHWLRKHAAWCQICVAISEGKWHKEGLKPDHCQPRSFKDWGLEKN